MDRFIVSTGRSGSTLLSRMLAENQRLLALSEFMSSMDNAERFRGGEFSGEVFRKIISADDDLSALIAARGRPSGEVLYEGVRDQNTATGRAPSLVRVTLPALTDDPEGLFEDISGFVSKQPSQDIGRHYRGLFEFLCQRLGKGAWVERSGFGIRLFKGIRDTFPAAKFLHLHRDGLEAALSMRAHPWFCIGAYFDFDPPTLEQAKAAILQSASEEEDVVSRHFSTLPPVEIYGRHWSHLLVGAYREMPKLNADQISELRFEDLVEKTKTALEEISYFLALPDDPGWIDRAAALVDEKVNKRALLLTPDEFKRLGEACLPGQILLGRAAPARLDEALETLREAFLSVRKPQE